MKKRVAASLLWFYCSWWAWAMIAALTGLPALAGPVIGAAVAALVGVDPFEKIWPRPASREQDSGAASATDARLLA